MQDSKLVLLCATYHVLQTSLSNWSDVHLSRTDVFHLASVHQYNYSLHRIHAMATRHVVTILNVISKNTKNQTQAKVTLKMIVEQFDLLYRLS